MDDASPNPGCNEDPLVVLIDDSVLVHRLLRARLRREPIRLRCACTGEEGLRLIEEESPAVILLDLQMPDTDGFQVLRVLRDQDETMNTPVLVLSGLDSPHDKVTAFDLGAHDYVTKPFDMTEFRARLRVALRMHHMLTMLEQRAQVDPLTGLWNRRYFDQRLEEEVAGAQRHERPLSLALMDLDHFKTINDTFGHPAGDSVLEAFAHIIRSSVRTSDVVCRYGGEEFCVIMPDTPPDDAQTMCERIRTRLEAIEWPRHPERRVTTSVGIAGTATPLNLPPREWIEQVDGNLYIAKREGRNRVVKSDVSGGTARLLQSA